jgi:hypothetical protein
VSPLDNDRFIELMRTRLNHAIAEAGGLRELPRGLRTLPAGLRELPAGLRELEVAYSVASLADCLEAAQEGLGASLIAKFADEPEGICPPNWPPIHWPPKGGGFGPDPEPGPILDRDVLGAALVVVSDLLGSEKLAELVRERGNEMMG